LFGQIMVLRRLREGLKRRPEPHDREDRIARTEQPGAPPGTLTVEPDSVTPRMRAIAYGPDGMVERDIADVEELDALLDKWPVTWLNVDGLGDVPLLQQLGDKFGIHNLTLEDVVHVDQRAKVEVFPSYVFAVARMVHPENRPLETEQLGMWIGDRFVVTFQEGHPGDCLDAVRRRLTAGAGWIRRRGPGYLAYALLDTVTDYYFPVLQDYGNQLDSIEDEIMGSPHDDVVPRIYEIKRDILSLLRAIRPQREAVATLRRETSELFNDNTRLHLRDVADHTEQLIDMLESYREMAAGLIDMYLSLSGHRMNEVMKVLTVIGSLFIPLTFITGLYGMNFDHKVSVWNMPELHFRYGYPLALTMMLVTTVGLLSYFWRKGWIGRS
jgi:magnesium transporter